MGVFRDVRKPVYDEQLMAQIEKSREDRGQDLDALYRQGETWAVS